MFQSFMWVSRVFRISSMGVLRQLQRRFKEVLRVFVEYLKCVSGKFQKSFKGVSRMFR